MAEQGSILPFLNGSGGTEIVLDPGHYTAGIAPKKVRPSPLVIRPRDGAGTVTIGGPRDPLFLRGTNVFFRDLTFIGSVYGTNNPNHPADRVDRCDKIFFYYCEHTVAYNGYPSAFPWMPTCVRMEFQGKWYSLGSDSHDWGDDAVHHTASDRFWMAGAHHYGSNHGGFDVVPNDIHPDSYQTTNAPSGFIITDSTLSNNLQLGVEYGNCVNGTVDNVWLWGDISDWAVQYGDAHPDYHPPCNNGYVNTHLTDVSFWGDVGHEKANGLINVGCLNGGASAIPQTLDVTRIGQGPPAGTRPDQTWRTTYPRNNPNKWLGEKSLPLIVGGGPDTDPPPPVQMKLYGERTVTVKQPVPRIEVPLPPRAEVKIGDDFTIVCATSGENDFPATGLDLARLAPLCYLSGSGNAAAVCMVMYRLTMGYIAYDYFYNESNGKVRIPLRRNADKACGGLGGHRPVRAGNYPTVPNSTGGIGNSITMASVTAPSIGSVFEYYVAYNGTSGLLNPPTGVTDRAWVTGAGSLSLYKWRKRATAVNQTSGTPNVVGDNNVSGVLIGMTVCVPYA